MSTARQPGLIELDLDREQQDTLRWLPERAKEQAAKGNFLEAFLLQWIAFNALCDAAYRDEAWRLVAKLKNGRNLQILKDGSRISGKFVRRQDGCELIIESPAEVSISLEEKNIESMLYSAFARDFERSIRRMPEKLQEKYSELRTWLLNAHTGCQSALSLLYEKECDARDSHTLRRTAPVIIDYAELRRHRKKWKNATYDQLRGAGVFIELSADADIPQVVRAIYKLRCNLFHGSRLPAGYNSFTSLVPLAYDMVHFMQNCAMEHMVRIKVTR